MSPHWVKCLRLKKKKKQTECLSYHRKKKMRKFSFPREKSSKTNPGATVHTCNLSPWEVEFKVSLGCIELDPDLIDTLSQKQTNKNPHNTNQTKPSNKTGAEGVEHELSGVQDTAHRASEHVTEGSDLTEPRNRVEVETVEAAIADSSALLITPITSREERI